jgi:hypothetical protein
MYRRKFLTLMISGGVFAVGGVARRARSVGLLPTDTEPYRLWSELTTQGEHRDLVHAAVLSANPHNSQPWKFRLADHGIDVLLDRSRALGPVDPFLRQMHIGVGCAIENLCVAARARGLSASAALLPDPANPDLAARVVLTAGGIVDARHADVIRRRHTNRGPYDRKRRPHDATCGALERQASSSVATLQLFEADSEQGRTFSRLTLAATEALVADAEFMRATDAWFRWTAREVSEHADGPSLRCAGLPQALALAAMLGPRQSAERFHASWLDATRDVHLATAPMFGFIAVPDGGREQLIEAGRLWQRVHLEATIHGLGMQPLDQAIEAWERARQREAASIELSLETLAPARAQLALMFRVGYPVRVAVASARRPLSAVFAS